MIEILESRVLLSAFISNGVLTINTDSGNDRLVVSLSSGKINVTSVGSFTATGVKRIAINSGGGDDYVQFVGISMPVSVNGGDGNDTIHGGYGNDTLNGGAGNDYLFGLLGNDMLYGGPGNNTLDGGGGIDTVSYAGSRTAVLMKAVTGGTYALLSSTQSDLITNTVENLIGTPYADTIVGNSGNNTLSGLGGNDRLYGLGGNDLLDGGMGNNIIDGGAGFDSIGYSSRTVPVRLKTFTGGVYAFLTKTQTDLIYDSMEKIVGTAFNDLLVGTASANYLSGLGGNDTLVSTGSGDTLVGGAGNDLLLAAGPNAVLAGGAGTDTADFSSRNVNLVLNLDDLPHSGAAGEKSQIYTDVENITGGSGSDRLVGNSGNNFLSGGGGNDTLIGGEGTDTLRGGNGRDLANYSDRTADLIVNLNSRAGSGAAGENDLIFTDVEDAVGGSGNDRITGNSSDNRLYGGAGNDTLDGGLGADTFQGGAGRDVADYSDRGENLTLSIDGLPGSGAAGEGDVIGADIEDLTGGLGNDRLTGDSADNILDGGAGNDTLVGGAGGDTLIGGDGRDLADYSMRSENLYLAIDGLPDSGFGEHDLISLDIEDVFGGSGNDLIRGSASDNRLQGGAGNDTLTGLDGNDTLLGEAGDDVLLADGGADVLSGGDGGDFADYSMRSADLFISLDDNANDGAAGEGDSVGSDIENVAGGSGNDVITGSYANTVANTFWGNDGNDTIDGGWGNDTLWGGSGFDMADYSRRGSGAAQQLRIGAGVGVEAGQSGSGIANEERDVINLDFEGIIGGPGRDWIEGVETDNLLIGGGGDDTLIGRAGNDTLIGGGGSDMLGHDIDSPSAADKDGDDDLIFTGDAVQQPNGTWLAVNGSSDGSIDLVNDKVGTNTIYDSGADGDVLDTVPGSLDENPFL